MVFGIFISYSTYDSDTAKRIENYLRQITNTEIYLYETQVKTGQISEAIIQKIRQCDLFIVLYSKNSIQSTYVQQEIGVAKGNHKIIIPILLDSDAKPDALLTGINYLSIYDEKKRNEQLPKLYQNVANESQKKASAQALLVIGGLATLAYLASKNK